MIAAPGLLLKNLLSRNPDLLRLSKRQRALVEGYSGLGSLKTIVDQAQKGRTGRRT